jgi:hypothetical protein
MRSRTTTRLAGCILGLCLAGGAGAAEHGHGKGGSTSTGTSGPSGGSPARGDTLSVEAQEQDDKTWEVGATIETHRLFIQSDLEGSANNKLMNFLYVYG